MPSKINLFSLITPLTGELSPLNDALVSVESLLSGLSQDSVRFYSIFGQSFGEHTNTDLLETIKNQWTNSDFSFTPTIEILDSGMNSIAGAYSTSNNTIYLSQSLINSNQTSTIVSVLLEEIGHSLDAQLNIVDTPGDEGEMFSALVRGQNLTPGQISAIKAENDATTITVNGELVGVEAGNAVYSWATRMGGTSQDISYGIAVDSSGNVYTTGYFQGTATFGSTSLTSAGSSQDIFVSKLNSNGAVAWATKMGGTNIDVGYGIDVDSSGNVYTTGYFNGNATFGTTSLTSAGSNDIFVTKLNSDGTVAWATKMGGASSDNSNDIAVDSSGNVYTTGAFNGAATFGATSLTSAGAADIFVSKLNSDGTVSWVTKMGGTSIDAGFGIAVDSSGNVYTTGYFQGTATFGTTSLTSAGSQDIFVSKLNSNGTVAWATKMGGTSTDSGNGIAVDSSGNVYTTGSFQGTATFGTTSLTSAGSQDIFVSKLNSDGTVAWATKMGGTNIDVGSGIAVESSGNVYTTGYFLDTATFGATSLTSSAGSQDMFVSKLNSNGTVAWATKMGGTSSEQGSGIAVDSSGNVYTTGYFQGTADFDPGAGTSNLTSRGGPPDIFVSKLAQNEEPTNLTLSATNVNENVAGNTAIGTFSTTDPDTGNTFTYSLVSGYGDNSAFSISGNQLLINASPDYETKSSYNIQVQTTDQGGLSFTKNVAIAVNNLNETPTNLTLSATNVNENVAANTAIGTFSTTDPDTGNTFTYSLVSGYGDNSSFSISGNQLLINASPDYETKSSYNIQVQTTDQGGLSFTKNLAIAVNDINETPTNLTLSANNVNENVAANTAIGTFSTTDPDTGNTFTYSLVSGYGDNSAFSISGNQLLINASPDYETKSSYNIQVQTTDQGGLFFTKNLAIAVNNLNETPTNLTLSATNINENVAANTAIGTFSTTDPDTGNTFTYSLVSGYGDNSAFSISGNQLLINASPDYETKSSYNIQVQTTDQGGLSFTKNLAIAVNDINETPTNLTLSATNVNENVAANTAIGTFSTTDPDTGNTFTYSLVSGYGDNSSFSISGNQLLINASPDYETKPNYNIQVQTTDQGGLSFTKNLAIAVNNLNEAPVVSNLIPFQRVEQNAAFSYTLPSNIFSDQDGDTLALSASGLPAWLSFNPTTKVLSGTSSSVGSYNFTVQAADPSNATVSTSFAISVIPATVNQDFSSSTTDVNYTAPAGSEVATYKGGSGNDIINASLRTGAVTAYGYAGNDNITGGSANDLLYGGTGNDTLTGNDGADKLYGEDDNDILFGGAGNDALYGGTGNDTLYGGAGNDSLWGQAGVDIFVIEPGLGADTIRDFVNGTDLLGLTGGLTFGALSFNQSGTSAQILQGSTLLATLINTNISVLDSTDFI